MDKPGHISGHKPITASDESEPPYSGKVPPEAEALVSSAGRSFTDCGSSVAPCFFPKGLCLTRSCSFRIGWLNSTLKRSNRLALACTSLHLKSSSETLLKKNKKSGSE